MIDRPAGIRPDFIAQTLEGHALQRLREPFMDALPHRLGDPLRMPMRITGRSAHRAPDGAPLRSRAALPVRAAIAAVEDPDRIRDRDLLGSFREHITAPRPPHAANEPLFLQAVEQLFKVGDRQILPLGDMGG